MRRVIFAIISTAAALVFLLSFKSHSTSGVAASPPAASAGPAPASSAPATPASPAAGGGASSSSAGSAASGSAAKTVTGDVAQTIYGPIQVKITVRNGKVTAADATEYPNDNPRDAQINSFAIPALNQEALSASSAQVDTISGATYTSQGYISSLQSALSKAGL